MGYKPLKHWFDRDLAQDLAHKIEVANATFPTESFTYQVESRIHSLELKDRVEVFADAFHNCLSGDYPNQVGVLLNILGSENDEETRMFANYYWIMPIAKFVEKYGLDHFDISINTIKEITKRNTGEYAIRPYLVKFTHETLQIMSDWSVDSNKHIRRLACEGLRPRLPWAKKMDMFINDPSPILPILEKLKDDPSKYVQNSVANCINDIIKDNIHIAKTLIENWIGDATPERYWIIRHSLRNLRKVDDPWALNILNKYII